MEKKVNWRKWLRVIHRDLGYLCVGLTIVYAVSGVAVNHVRDWNPSYAIGREGANIGALEYDVPVGEDTIREVLDRLGLPPGYKTRFQPDPDSLRIIKAGHTISVDLPTGMVVQERVGTRPVLYESNFLHLNHPKRAWTWVADLFAVALIVLAVSGMFILKGRQGITGRGLWLTLAGFAVPLVFLWLYL